MQHTILHIRHTAQTDSDGRLTQVDFEAYCYSDSRVFWSVERLYNSLAAAAGVQKTTLKDYLKQDTVAWQIFGDRLGLDIKVERGAHQIRHVRLAGGDAQATCYTRDEVTMPSVSSLAVQVLWGFGRTQHLWQARAKSMILALLSRCVEIATVWKECLLTFCGGSFWFMPGGRCRRRVRAPAGIDAPHECPGAVLGGMGCKFPGAVWQLLLEVSSMLRFIEKHSAISGSTHRQQAA